MVLRVFLDWLVLMGQRVYQVPQDRRERLVRQVPQVPPDPQENYLYYPLNCSSSVMLRMILKTPDVSRERPTAAAAAAAAAAVTAAVSSAAASSTAVRSGRRERLLTIST